MKLSYFIPVVNTSLDANQVLVFGELHDGVPLVEVAVLHALDVYDGVFILINDGKPSNGLVTLAHNNLTNICVGWDLEAIGQFSCITILRRASSVVHLEGQGFEVLVHVVMDLGNPKFD